MAGLCSVPGCSGKNNLLNQNKLYRVPATPIASSGLIYDLTKSRRSRWIEILQHCGLTEENSSNYRVCSNHFKGGKPAPIFESKSEDWVPNFNLMNDNLEPVVVTEKRKGRQKKPAVESNDNDEECNGSSKSTNRNKDTDNPKSEKSVSGSGNKKTKEEPKSPFVFVDIQKIKNNEDNVSFERTVQKTVNMRSFASQTNPNVLPPLNWGKSRSKKQPDPRFQSVMVQTIPTASEPSAQASLGEMIEYIRKQVLDFNFVPFGKSYKITECAIHFEKEPLPVSQGQTQQAAEKSIVIIQGNKLLSSNWPLLESIAKSIDLHKSQKKNEKKQNDLMRVQVGKKETLDQTTSVAAKLSKPSIPSASTSSVKKPNSTPKMSNVTKKSNISTPNTATASNNESEIPSPESVSMDDSGTIETNANLNETQMKLGTNKVARILLPKLPDSVVYTALNGGSVPATIFAKKNNVAEKMKPIAPLPLPNSEVPLPTGLDVMNSIKVKTPEKSGVAGYIVVPKGSVASTSKPVLYLMQSPHNTGKTVTKNSLPSNVQNLSRLFTKPTDGGPAIPLFPVTPVLGADANKAEPKTSPPKLLTTEPTNTVVVSKIPTEAKDDGSLRCPYCKKDCDDGVDFIEHFKGCKGKRNASAMLKCDKCTKYYLRNDEHKCDEKVRRNVVDCNICGRVFAKSAYLANHVRTHAEYALWTKKCFKCPKRFETDEQLEDHKTKCEMWIHHTKKYQCTHCAKSFMLEGRLEAHMRNVHSSDGDGKPARTNGVNVKCRRCENVYDLFYYRATHWKECQPKTDDERTKSTDVLEIKQEIDGSESTETKKPMGIRSAPCDSSSDDDLGTKIEDELNKMFHGIDDIPPYGLVEDFEEKIKPTEINGNKRESKKRKFEDLDDDEYEGLLEVTISKGGKETTVLLTNGNSSDEGTDSTEVCLQSNFDMTDCLNDISFEEIEEVD